MRLPFSYYAQLPTFMPFIPFAFEHTVYYARRTRTGAVYIYSLARGGRLYTGSRLDTDSPVPRDAARLRYIYTLRGSTGFYTHLDVPVTFVYLRIVTGVDYIVVVIYRWNVVVVYATYVVVLFVYVGVYLLLLYVVDVDC